MIEMKEAGAASDDAVRLLTELNETLARITGASGKASFDADDMGRERAAFVIAYVNGAAAGCGALRPLSDSRAEIKRVYARPNILGVGTAIVKALEEKSAGVRLYRTGSGNQKGQRRRRELLPEARIPGV